MLLVVDVTENLIMSEETQLDIIDRQMLEEVLEEPEVVVLGPAQATLFCRLQEARSAA